jgi:hypothetical protein
MSKGKIYIAGPMRGKAHLNFEEFFVAARQLRNAGWEPWNPAAHDVDNWWAGNTFDPKTGLLFDITKVNEADAIFMLEGWEKSDGARCEYYYAKFIGIEIIFQSVVDAALDGELGEPFVKKNTVKGLRRVTPCPCGWWTQGKFYPYIDDKGTTLDDDGDQRYVSPCYEFEEAEVEV